MRSIWKGSISFGLVNIPVAVFPATREEKVAFKQLRQSDHSLIKQKKVAEADGAEVPAAEIVKGYEYEKGKFVVLTEEDFDKVKIESTHTIEITDFVELAAVNPKFFSKPYFLEPQKGGDKGYTLLHKALSETGKIGIAKVAIRSREYLAAVKPDGLFLILELMHFAQEVLEPEGLRDASAEVGPRELAMAKTLIEAMSGEWEPAKYADEYQDALRAMIEAKVAKKPAGAKAPAAPKEMVGDILAILQASLTKNAERKKAPAKSGTRSPAKTTAALVKTKRRGVPASN